jgi:hypothetical protein
LKTGTISLQNLPASQSQISAAMQSLSLASLISERGLIGWPSPGNCTVLEVLTGGSADIADPVQGQGLDAGMLTLQGGTLTAPAPIGLASKGFYSAQLGSTILGPGTYTVSNGSGGGDIGPFTANVTTPPAINWTNMGALFNLPRGQDLSITWSGTAASDDVAILGVTALPSSAGQVPMFEFLCIAFASAGQFNVPSLVLSSIPNTAQVQGTPGITLAVSDVSVAPFTARGLDVGFISSFNFVSRFSGLQ